ncbi:hypothetical protein H8A99_42060 [Bradyrhizobium sp. Arg68]|uniref:hypothetical protein n=1 Tax=Bradyrhizobium ivorense TaxID=2511166 RepID=UPI001E558E53|nr:hypothetical protein [Bradyrhizobium ivorense]MCC8942824.1 hypothetical protein [Bradyrhizobium ivorense]
MSAKAHPQLVFPLRAATRDAAWYGTEPPDERRPPKFHVVAKDSAPACGQRGMILNDDTTFATWELAAVPRARRCQRPGCREHWPTDAHHD